MACCNKTIYRLAIAALGICLNSTVLWGQKASLAAQRGPHYVGEPFVIQVTAAGFDEEPTPEITLGQNPDGLRIAFLNVSPSVSSSITIINGRRTESRTVVFRFNYRVTGVRAGNFLVPAVTVKQGRKSAKTNPLTLAIRKIDEDPNMRIELLLPDAPVYPGQRVKVKVKWWYAGNLSDVNQLIIYSPLFDKFEFQDQPVRRGDSALPLTGAKGKTQVKAVVTKQTLDGKQYMVATAERTLLAEKVGEHQFNPIVVNVSQVVRWKRDFFGDRVAAAVRRIQARGKPARLTVKPLPLKNRPESFAGAIGSGFSIKARASHTVVKLGDPITLTLTLRGDGRLQNAGLPPLFADGKGLDPKQFTTSGDSIPGEMTEDGKEFKVSVRIIDPSVSQVPPIAYSWFDPELGEYKTTTSTPIAMQVGKAKIVGTRDVVSARPNVAEDGGKSSPSKPATNVPSGFDTSGADLAIVADAGRLLVNTEDRFGGTTTLVAIYVSSVLALLVMFVLGRRAARDPQAVAARSNVHQQIGRLRRAGGMSAGQQAVEISAVLRILATHVPMEKRDELDRIMRDCDNLAFATSDRVDSDELDLHARAMALVKEIG